MQRIVGRSQKLEINKMEISISVFDKMDSIVIRPRKKRKSISIDIDAPRHLFFWYELSRLYFHPPVAGLGGCSCMEYAEKEQLPNLYLISGSPKLLTLLEKEAKRSLEALEMQNQLKYMLNVDD